MKTKYYLLISGLILLLLSACNASLPPSRDPKSIRLTLKIMHDEHASFQSIRCQIILKNQSNTSLLVNGRLFVLPQQAPPELASVLLLINDSSGKAFVDMGKVDYDSPREMDLIVLKPGEQVEKIFVLSGYFLPFEFQKGEKYSLTVVYQNNFDVAKTVDGVGVTAWLGNIRSNEVTLVIVP